MISKDPPAFTTTMLSSVPDLLRCSAERFPGKVCLSHGSRSLTFRELYDDARRLAQLLIEFGVLPNDRVAVHLDKSTDEVTALLAVSMAGGVFVNLNSLLKARQVRHILNDSGAQVLISSYSRLKSLGQDLTGLEVLRQVIACGSRVALREDALEGLELTDVAAMEAHRPCTPVRRIDRDLAAIIYTSGSTGLPKGVVLSHRNLIAGAESVASYLKNTERDRILSVLPFSFDYGLNQLTTSLLVGATLVLKNHLSAADTLRTLAREEITGLAGIPTIWSQFLQADWTGLTFPSLRYITNSGGRFAEEHVKEYRRRLPDTRIYLMYGLTEAFRSTFLDPDEIDRRPTSIGKAIPNAEILVMTEDGRECAAGEVGELVHRGAHVALGYWNEPTLTAHRFRPNPLQPAGVPTEERVVYSGDLVKRDAEGFLYFVGRRDHMIKTSGYRISPTEVEEYFYNTGLVQDVVAYGRPDETLGEHIKVTLSFRRDVSISAEELLSIVARQMPSYMVPKQIEVLDELPKNQTGKLDRVLVASGA